ncbi:MAG: hypothetical protein ACR2QU_02440 [Gammaproteobacteria bacterium]
MSKRRDDARRILEPLKEQYQGPHDIVRVSESDFPHLNFSTYTAAGKVLQAAGYRHLADVELRDVSRNKGNLYHPTLIRKFQSTAETTLACLYLLRPRLGELVKLFARGMRNLRWISTPALMVELLPQRLILDLETEWGEGQFVVTSNAEAAAMMTAPPTIDNLFFPYETEFQILLAAHESRVGSISAGSTITQIRSYDDSVAMSRRQKLQKDAHRAALDWISKDELTAMGDGRQSAADDLFEEIQKLLREETSNNS